MARRGKMMKLAVAAGLLWAWQAGAARADHTETRDYSIFVGGKEAGQSRFVITQKDDGTATLAASASVKVQFIITYTYQVDSTEVWKDGKLVNLNLSCNENGKRTSVQANAQGSQLRVVVNGSERLIRPDVWTTSYWKLADARFHNKTVPILDADSGKESTAQLQYVGTEQINIGSQPENCYHFRVVGSGNPIDLWYDRYHRLVRQDFVEQGHRTIIQLVNVKR